jgi:hypothetical protein
MLISQTNILAVEKALHLPKMILELRSDGIVYCTYAENAVVFRHDVEEGVQKRIEVFGDTKKCFIVDVSSLKGISSDARKYFATRKGSHNIKAVAFLVKKNTMEGFAMDFLEENLPPFKAEVFEDPIAAKAWINQFND